MAKKEITLRVDEWRLIHNSLGGSALPQTIEDQVRQHRLWEMLDRALATATEPEVMLTLLSAQRTILINVLQRPPIPWRTDAAPRIWRLLGLLGYKLPDVEDADDVEPEDA